MTNDFVFCACACITVICAFFLLSCIPPLDNKQVLQEAGDGSVSGEVTLILEETQSVDSLSTERLLPTPRNLTDYIDALDMRIGVLYQSDTRSKAENRFRSCVEQYRRYVLRIDDLEAQPVQQDAHPSLSDQITGLQTHSIVPLSTRIGNADINSNNSVALLPILVMTGQGYTVGELECRKDDEAWYVYDIVLDIESVANNEAERATQFNPLLF